MVGILSRHRRAILVSVLLVLSAGVCLRVALPPAGFEALAEGQPRPWAKLRALVGSEDLGRAPVQHSYVPLSAIAFDLQLAVVMGEDIGFFDHGAWDLRAVREALEEWLAGRRLRGASTLTQQLAKNLFLSDERSLWRKVREAGYARWLEERLGKRRILELYLNVVELGPGVLGAEAGARHYFGISAAALDADQAAELAASIPSPHKHNPRTRTRPWWVRYRAIRARMQHSAPVRERLLALSGPVRSAPAERDESALPAFGESTSQASDNNAARGSEDGAGAFPSPAVVRAEASEESAGATKIAGATETAGATASADATAAAGDLSRDALPAEEPAPYAGGGAPPGDEAPDRGERPPGDQAPQAPPGDEAPPPAPLPP